MNGLIEGYKIRISYLKLMSVVELKEFVNDVRKKKDAK